MKSTITITSKGQTTIPAPLRRKLGLDTKGGVLSIRFDDARGELVVSKSLNIDELADKLSGYIKPSTKPLIDVDAFYQTNREGRS